MRTLRASRLFRRAYPARVAARIDRKRALPVAIAGVLVVAAGRSRGPRAARSGACRGAALVGAAERLAAARARSAGQAARAAASGARGRRGRLRAGPRGRRPRRPSRARARAARRGRSARPGGGRAAALPPGRPETAIGVLRALASNDDRAPVPALHLGLALLWSGQRGEATSELEQTRLIDPDGFYGSTADDVLHPSYRKGYPLWLRSRPVSGSLAELRARAAQAPRSLRAQLGYAYGLQFQLAHARAARRRARARARRQRTSTPRWRSSCSASTRTQPAQAVGPPRAADAEPRPTRPARASTSASCSPGSVSEAKAKKQYRQALALDPSGLIGRFARSVLNASS